MERRMESKEWKWGGTVTQGENGHAIPVLAASEQFHTRSCARCAGLLVNDWCYDLVNSGEQDVNVLRCVQCGHRVDPVILRNQIRPPVAKGHVRRVHPKRSVSMEMLTRVA